MQYLKFPPADQLKPYVECYYSWKGLAEKELDVQSPPNSFCAVIINCGDGYAAYQHLSPRTEVPKAFVCGLFTSNYHLVLRGNIDIVGIVLKPAAMYNFYGFKMTNLVNNRVPLKLVAGDLAEKLTQHIQSESDNQQRVKCLEEFMITSLHQAVNKPTIIDEAMELIDQHHGCISVEAVADKLKISRRYLEKKFLEKVGMSPKFYTRIRRFMMLSREVAYNKNLNWQDLVFKYSFHDQSHLVKEFMEFNQMNPTDYFTKHQELIRFVKR